MTDFAYQYEPDAPFASEGQPLFFRRRYTGTPAHATGGVVYVDLVAPGDTLTIYGYSIRLTGEDGYHAREVWQRRRAFYAWCASIKEPRGEPGFVPLLDVEPITREEFEYAAAEGWPGE